MKNVFKALTAVLLFSALLFGSKYAYFNWAGGAEVPVSEAPDANAVHTPVRDWAAPDIESLADYGLRPFTTTLPVLFIDTQGVRVSKENKIWAKLAVLGAAGGGEERSILETPDYQEAVTLKYRGASSYAGFDKKQYRIKFFVSEGSGEDKNIPFLGMGKNSEWVLNGPFLDKTLMRNRLVYGLGREMFEWAPDSRYVELFVDGVYQGVYLVVEPVGNGETRLRLSKFGLLSGDTAYILKRDRVGTEDAPLDVYGKLYGKTNNDLFIEYPSAKKLTNAQRDWITADISAFERALYSDYFDDPDIGYAKYIDVDCFADYFILNETVMNNDAGNLSTYPYKELGGKLKLAIWDYNNSYDNYQWFKQDFSEIFLLKDGWFRRLLQDRAFVDRVVERYKMWRQSVLSTEHMLEALDAYRAELGPAVDRNFAVWGYTFSINLMSESRRDIRSYDEAVLQLRLAIRMRFNVLDEHITDLYKYCVN